MMKNIVRNAGVIILTISAMALTDVNSTPQKTIDTNTAIKKAGDIVSPPATIECQNDDAKIRQQQQEINQLKFENSTQKDIIKNYDKLIVKGEQKSNFLLDTLSKLSIIIASLVAIYGIDAWRREYRGKKDIELAEETLVLFYKAKDAISAIRNPFGFSGEGTTRKAYESETEKQKKYRDQAYSFYERFEKRQDVFTNLLSIRYRFMARFGKDKSYIFDSIKRIVDEIMISANFWADLMIDLDASNKEQLKEAQEVIWHHGKDDKIDAQIDKTIQDIENLCKPIIMNTRSTMAG